MLGPDPIPAGFAYLTTITHGLVVRTIAARLERHAGRAPLVVLAERDLTGVVVCLQPQPGRVCAVGMRRRSPDRRHQVVGVAHEWRAVPIDDVLQALEVCGRHHCVHAQLTRSSSRLAQCS